MAGRVRVAHLTSYSLPNLGGIECHIHNIVSNLPDFEFDVLTARVPGLAPPRAIANVRVHRLGPPDLMRGPRALPLRGRLWFLGLDLLSLWQLSRQRRRLERVGADIVHSHWNEIDVAQNLRGILPERGRQRLLEKAASAPTFSLPTLFTDHSILVQELSESRRRLVEHALRTYRVILCVEREGVERAKEIRDSCGGTAEIDFVPNSVDTTRFRPALPGDHPPTIGYVGQANKGHWIIFELARLLPETHFLCVVAGSPRALRKWRERRSTQFEVLENVQPDDLPAALARMDLVAGPILAHGISRVTLESLATGIPVIAAAGRSRYPLVQGRTGALVDPTPEAFAAAARDLLENPSRRRDYGREGRRMVEAEFSNDVVLPRVAAWYRRLAT